MRSDGAVLPIEVPDDLVETLLSAGFKPASETTTIKARDGHGGGATENASYTYAVTNQQLVVEVLGRIPDDSYSELP